MKDEIKEILEDYSCIPRIKKLGDYITNLQEENEIQKEKIEHLLIDLRGESEYKSRNEKAIEYIHSHQPVFELSNKEQIQEWFEKEYYIDLLNILNGDDK